MSPQEQQADTTISNRLAPVIAAAAERIHYAESRRANYSTMAGALIAAGIAIFTFALASLDREWMRYGAVASSVSMIVVGALVIYVFGLQTNRYPFTSATRTWKWFYRDALPNQAAFDLKPWQRWSTQKARVQKAYGDQLPTFKSEMQKLLDDETDLDQDIQQAYVLHINEKYKNLYLSRLRTLFNRGLISIACATLIGGLLGLYSEHLAHQPMFSHVADTASVQTIEYRLVSSPLSETSEYAIKLSARNNLVRPVSVRKLFARDDRGWPLPVEISYMSAVPQVVPPHQSIALFATLKCSRAVSDDIASINAEIR